MKRAALNQTVRLEVNTTDGDGGSTPMTGATARCVRFTGQTGSISAITKASPGEVTSAGHGLENGDEVLLRNIAGMVEVTERVFTVANKTTDTFELSGEDTTGHTTFTSGSWELIKTTTSGITALIDFRTQGCHVYEIDTSADSDFFDTFTSFYLHLEGATVDGQTINNLSEEIRITGSVLCTVDTGVDSEIDATVFATDTAKIAAESTAGHFQRYWVRSEPDSTPGVCMSPVSYSKKVSTVQRLYLGAALVASMVNNDQFQLAPDPGEFV